MSSADYWKKREQEAKKATIRDEEEYRKRIETIYKQTYEAVERQINDWYARYASKNGLSMSEARMRVKKLDMERYERLAAKYVATHDFSDQANEEMEIYNLTMRINRLELLKAQINLELLAGYDDLDKELEREFIEQAMKEDRRLAGILGDSVIGNQRYAKQIVNASFWNATYSERIWGNNMPRLRSSIETQLRNGIIQGIHSTELARNLRKSFDVSIRDSERLMITEVRRIQTEIQKDSFDRNGFKEYRFISAGDGRVCPECERLHGQHFKVSEMQPGENAPPMHPVCRCSTAAWMDGEKYKRWLEALERGEDVRWKDFEIDNRRGQINSERTAHKHPISQGIIRSTVNPMIKSDGTVKPTDVMRPHNIFKNLEGSSVGRTTLNYLNRNQVNVKIYYNVDNPYGDSGVYDPVSDEIIVYGDITKTIHETACTIIHETAHRILGCSQTRSEEVICFMEEAKHIKGKLTMDDVNAIVKAVNDSERYQSLPWGVFNVWDEKYLE